MNSDLSAANRKTKVKSVDSFSDEILETIFNNVHEGILLIDYKGNLLKANQEGINIHGLEHKDKDIILNQPFTFNKVFNLHGQEIPSYMGPVERLLNGESFKNQRYVVRQEENGSDRSIIYSGFPQFDNDGNFSAGVLFARSVFINKGEPQFAREVFEQEEQFNQLESYKQKLENDQELLQTIIDTIPVMITIYDKRVQSFIMNRAFVNVTGWTNSDIAKSNIMELAYPDPIYRKEIYEFMQSLASGFKDLVIRTRDGRDIETSWANIEIPDGRQVGVGIDISERKQLEKQLTKAREKAEKEARIQYAFIQNISHEVRTPMNSILGFTELLKKEITRKKEAEFLNAISQNGKQLLRLIDDIIDFSQLDNNQISIQKGNTNLSDLMKQIEMQTEGMKKSYKKRHLNLYVKYPEKNVRVILNTDELRLQQVLLNLVDNAIKYTDRGTVEIGFEIREEHQDILFYVKDTGIGIDASKRKKVFRRFNRLHDTHRKEFRGTGLGLAICKHLVALLGGKIWFESKPDVGTVFYFNHPYFTVNEVIQESEDITVESEVVIPDVYVPDLSEKVILIVEDDSFSYMMMYHMLEETRALILHADTGHKAIEIFDKYKIDLVFLDIRLPEIDGYEVLKYMHQVNKGIPVIAQTANALPEDTRKIKEAGFNHHITKPISRDSLFYVMNKFLT